MTPDRFCDIVMKGGITSGVVYPQAVLELRKAFRFKSVGGTSAGAIAAAATAAAEHDRDGGGFDRLATLPKWIGAGDNLSALFQPQGPLRGVFSVLLAVIEKRWSAVAGRALRHYPVAALLGALPGALAIVAVLSSDDAVWEVVGVAFSALLTVIGAVLAMVVWMAAQASRALPGCFYGMCSGMPEPGSNRVALTPWLTDLLDTYAGRPTDGPPLTFGDLWHGKDGTRTPEDPALRLEMMTTNLTNRRAERMPWASREFFYDPAEIEALFPRRVLDHMRRHPPAGVERIGRFLPLPDAENLPVIVATRMSLSFPVLLSAIPLWRVDYTLKAKEPEPCWFSDGGISSNLPVHFFDAPLPRHPTFAINLRDYHPEHRSELWMAKSASEPQRDWFYRFDGEVTAGFDSRIVQFLSGVVRTMQNRVDEAQMRVPGYRERVLHMSMSSEEGGMNLTMPAHVLEALLARGEKAGVRMTQQFETGDPVPETVTWDEHRWVRLRTSLLATTEMLDRFTRGYDFDPPAGAKTYEALIGDPPDLYPFGSAERQELARRVCREIRELVAGLDERGLEPNAPRPRPVARIVPRD